MYSNDFEAKIYQMVQFEYLTIFYCTWSDAFQ